MKYFEWIEKFLYPPSIKKTNWGRVYKLLGTLADGYAAERVWLLRQHFALTCEFLYFKRLGCIYGLPRWSFESDAGYRKRLISAGFELEQRGSIKEFRWFMDGLFGANGSGKPVWISNGEAPSVFAVGRTAVGGASVGGISLLRVGIKAVGAFTVSQSPVGRDVIGGRTNTLAGNELRTFLDWFLAADIAYEIYYL